MEVIDISNLLDHCQRHLHQLQDSSGRLFHGRGGVYPGLEAINVEKYGQLLAVVLYQPWSEQEPLELALVDFVSQHSGLSQLAIQHRYQPQAPWQWLIGNGSELVITEQGLRYQLRFDRQNPGLFLDMAEGRRWVRHNTQGKRVLNLFSYTCAFAVVAAAGGAESVVNFDMSSAALNQGRHNLKLNDLTETKQQFLAHDILKSLGKITRLSPYDLIIIDPPNKQPGSFDPQAGYRRILNRADEWLNPGGYLLLTLNEPRVSLSEFRALVEGVVPDSISFQQRIENPELIKEREAGQGLKVLLYQKVC